MKRKRRELLALLAGMILSPAAADGARYIQLFQKIDYGGAAVYVIGHKSPDPDSIGSAIALAELLNAIGIQAVPAASERIDNESAYALKALELEPPLILDDAEGKQFILVDHCVYAHAIDHMDLARVVGILDHHGVGDIKSTELIPVFSMPVGAAASLVFMCYRGCGTEMTPRAARAMLMGILSDTRNMTYNVTAADREAYEALLPIAGIEDADALYEGMKDAKTTYDGMTTGEIFYSKYKEYEAGPYRFGIGSVFASPETIAEVSAEMKRYMREICPQGDLDYLFCMVSDSDSTWLSWVGDGAEELVRESFQEYDGSEYVIFRPATTRKLKIVPPLVTALENRDKK
ncbi:MAG: DHH family phosphoesterase [Clostridia bacterium]|nr:DHH family phosphoesterase [Clostridia bacterium]